MAVSKKPSLTPKAPQPDPVQEGTQPMPEPVQAVPEGPEVDRIINDTKEADARRKAAWDELEAARRAEEAAAEADRIADRKYARRHMEWLRPGVDDVPRQTNLMLPNKLKMRVEHVCRYGAERTNMAKVVTALLDAWVREQLEEMNIDYD
jgi:hypothetical protein